MIFKKGVTSPVIGAMLENAVVFTLYEQTKLFLLSRNKNPSIKQLSVNQSFVAGGVAGCGTTLVLTPVELIKCRLQIQQESKQEAKYKGVVDCIYQTVKNEGFFRGLYRGVGMYVFFVLQLKLG